MNKELKQKLSESHIKITIVERFSDSKKVHFDGNLLEYVEKEKIKFTKLRNNNKYTNGKTKITYNFGTLNIAVTAYPTHIINNLIDIIQYTYIHLGDKTIISINGGYCGVKTHKINY